MHEIDPNLELYLAGREERFLEKVQKLYAIKLIERIVFSILALFGIAIVMQLIDLLKNARV